MSDRARDGAARIPDFESVLEARERISPIVHRTPVLTSRALDRLTGASLYFKCENFQKTGSFKVRGAANAVLGLSGERAAKGVATHSSGNHGLALSFAAGLRGIPCRVAMPRTAPAVKRLAVEGYGGQIVECEASTASREAALERVCAATEAEFVHPYDDPRVIAGQATCSAEFLEQAGPLDILIAPIGGGGMVSGACLAVSAWSPETSVWAAEPEQADDAFRSLRAGRIVADDAPETVADGLKVPLRALTWHFVSRRVAGILTVSESEIVDAMRLLWTRTKLVAEPSSAVPLAAILKRRDVFADKRVGVVLTGGNVDLDRLPWMRN